jgi:hypothetical protein
MHRMSPRPSARLVLGFTVLSALSLPLACGGGQSGGASETASGKGGACEQARPTPAACSGSSEAKLPKLEIEDASKQEQKAVQRINEQIQRLSAEQGRLCGEYAACAIDEETFEKSTAALKARVDALPGLLEGMKSAKTYGQRKRALDEIYQGVVPAEARVEELMFRMSMRAELPASAGGKTIDVQPGSALPTNARVAFAFEVTRDAYLYIFQKAPNGTVNVLFPDARIGTQNPLRAGAVAEIPPNGQRFRLNDQDIGLENVYIVASQGPVQSLDAALQKVKDGKVTKISDDAMLRSFVAVQPGTAPEGCKTRALELDVGTGDGPSCTRSRGLVLEAAPRPGQRMMSDVMGDEKPSSSGARPSGLAGRAVMEVRTDPGDNLIVKVFPFKHTSEQDYKLPKRGGPGGVVAGAAKDGRPGEGAAAAPAPPRAAAAPAAQAGESATPEELTERAVIIEY